MTSDKNQEPDKRPQIDKFKETAKQVETDDSEERFDRALRKVARATEKADSTPVLKRQK